MIKNEHDQPIGESLSDWSPPSHPEPAVLEGDYCRLEPLRADLHARALFAANAKDPSGKKWTYLPYGPFASFEDYCDWVTTVSMSRDPQFYAILIKCKGEPARAVGIASYLRIKPEVGVIEVGHLHFSELLQCRPAATEAMFLMMKRVFDLGYRRYEWKCDALNAQSCAAAQRLGFSFEGIFKQATVYKHRNRDTAWFSVTDSEWPALEKEYLRWLAADNFDEMGVQASSLRELTRPNLRSIFTS
ncbi:MAG: RimJ/RimL family protein N-acetyltransferase [Verrucomicrobiales bacterium]